VFKINTCLWGGVYNPIIPYFKKTPPNWEDRRFRHPPASSIIKGYLDSFDPDYLVVKDKQKIAGSLFDKERLLSFDDVMNSKDEEPISYGVDVTDFIGTCMIRILSLSGGILSKYFVQSLRGKYPCCQPVVLAIFLIRKKWDMLRRIIVIALTPRICSLSRIIFSNAS
jgi:hypothetical protein